MIYSTEDKFFVFFLKPSLWRVPGVHDDFNKRQQRNGGKRVRRELEKLMTVPDFDRVMRVGSSTNERASGENQIGI